MNNNNTKKIERLLKNLAFDSSKVLSPTLTLRSRKVNKVSMGNSNQGQTIISRSIFASDEFNSPANNINHDSQSEDDNHDNLSEDDKHEKIF